MNQLINYLYGRLGKKTCPIVSVETVHNFDYNYPFREWFVVKFKDGSKIELMERPKLKDK